MAALLLARQASSGKIEVARQGIYCASSEVIKPPAYQPLLDLDRNAFKYVHTDRRDHQAEGKWAEREQRLDCSHHDKDHRYANRRDLRAAA